MSQSKISRIIYSSLFILGGLVMAANLIFQSFFAGKALPGAKLGQINLTGKNFAQISDIASMQTNTSSAVNLYLSHSSIALHLGDINLLPDSSRFAAQVTKPSDDNWLPLLGLFRQPAPTRLGFTTDSLKLESALKNLISGIGQPASNATIAINDGQVSVVPGTPGLGIEPHLAAQALTSALSDGSNAVSIAAQSIEPSIQPADLEPIATQIKARLAQNFILNYQGKQFEPSRAIVGSWLGVSEGVDGTQMVVNSDQIKAYLNAIGKTINVAAKNKVINTVNGAVQATEEGANGLAINQASLATTIGQALLANQALNTQIPTQVVAFKTVYNRTYNLDFGKYIEVNLSMQHMWVYQDHQVVMDTPITSGSTGTGHPTVQGLFAVYTKERNRWLDGRPLGYNYDVYVQYWMPFHADYGLHDASWRRSFGGPDYYYGGSHGCVNMPPPAAAWLYGWVDVGTPVWIHA